MAALLNVLKSTMDDTVREELEKNTYYQKTKGHLDDDARWVGEVQKVATVFTMSSVILTAVGVGYCAAGRDQLGGALIAVNVPLSIFSYNCYRASENFRSQVLEDPTQLMVLTAINRPILIHQIALRKCLLSRTICFEPFLGIYVRVCINSGDSQPSVSPPLAKKIVKK